MNGESLTPSELLRYSRHIILPGFGEDAQQRLKSARVLVVGAGGLGSALLYYLTAAGVGAIGVADHDVVSESNLQRQVLFTTADIGKKKSEVAKERLTALNPHINIVSYPLKITSENASELIGRYDVIADGSDNFPTRYLINDACVLLGKTVVLGAVFRFEGQVSVFNMLQKDGSRGPNYRDIFSHPPEPGSIPDCTEGGVIGVLPGIIGCMQANEVIKIITGIGEPLSGKLLLYNSLNGNLQTLHVKHDRNNPLTGTKPAIKSLIDYEQFCSQQNIHKEGMNVRNVVVREISAGEFIEMQQNNTDFQLIDVREQGEYERENIGGELIPLDSLAESVNNISRHKPVIIHCHSGKRSADAIEFLTTKYGYTNLYNLSGGLVAYFSHVEI